MLRELVADDRRVSQTMQHAYIDDQYHEAIAISPRPNVPSEFILLLAACICGLSVQDCGWVNMSTAQSQSCTLLHPPYSHQGLIKTRHCVIGSVISLHDLLPGCLACAVVYACEGE